MGALVSGDEIMGPYFSQPAALPPKQSKFDGKETPLHLQVASDLHLEYYSKADTPEKKQRLFEGFIEPSAPYLALLGDIGYPGDTLYREFLVWCGERFQKVLVVLGNHEFYKNEYYTTLEQARTACEAAGPNVVFCHDTAVELDHHLVLATTLWSFIPETKMTQVQAQLSDYHLISITDPETKQTRYIVPRDTVSWHNNSVAWIKQQIAQTPLPVVILSHHAPSMTCSEPDIPPTSEAASAFCSELDYLFEDPVIGWGFGHTHFPIHFKSGTCRIMSNPAGYPQSEFPDPYNRPYARNGVLKV